jgi:uncharacterized membrane protein YgdD (TMEM256/DUF423 family)
MGIVYPNPFSKATSRAVYAMGIIMLLKKDPTFLFRDLAVFLILGLVVFGGGIYILWNFKKVESHQE